MMDYEYELNFFLDVLKKCHVHAAVLGPADRFVEMLDPHFASVVGFSTDATVAQVLGEVAGNTKYKFSNEFKFQYAYIRLPGEREKNILSVGPYVSAALSARDILEIAEQTGIPIDAQKSFTEYCFSLPILSEGDSLFVALDAFCERIFQTASFAIVEHNKAYRPFMLAQASTVHGDAGEEIEANIKMMEKRYSFENEMIRAVSLGQQHKSTVLISQLNQQLFEKRVADPLRNAKNYCIIMNTLLRKAAEQGGVHPIYIDKESSQFAMKIELLSTPQASAELMAEMFSSYCRLVYKHSAKKLSPIVKKTVLIIDSDISAELSLQGLASKLGVSAGYLATVFKKETGKTVLEYIKNKRIEHATYLLETTSLQIQTVALHCGVMDVQYFSKMFKNKTGKTPKEYRETACR